MITRALATATLFAFSVVLSPEKARAQEKDAVTEMARQRFQEGVKFFDQKKYEEARAAFLQAYALKRHPAVLLNLAQSELRSAHPADASNHFAAFLRESPNASGIERSEAERGLNDARSKIGRLHITVNVTGADVFIDGEQVGQSPVADALEVTTGSHAIEARYNGRSAASIDEEFLVGPNVIEILTRFPAQELYVTNPY
jgi:tetratricopeptide (TPR) repeat protein